MEAYNKHYSAYKKLRNTIDSLSDSLSEKYQFHLKCRSGCDVCCMNYTILPVEFYFIQKELEKNKNPKEITGNMEKSDGCIFLKDHTCLIYDHRPIICRTHGLPLLYTNDDYEWELSTCELNFTQFDYLDFTPDNTFPQDKINSRLFMLNRNFIAEFKEKKYSEFERISLKKVAELI